MRTQTRGLVREVKVRAGDLLFTMEVMKMEGPYAAPCDGTVEAVHVSEGGEGIEAGLVAVVID